jgi:tRNA pseudouridine13 synthase
MVFIVKMYKIKHKPEDFIVREISNLHFLHTGNYLVCVLKKRNYTILRAIEHIANALGIRIKDIGFSGMKDKNAVTEQYISIKGVAKERVEDINLKDISLRFVGYLDRPISLGNLEGNYFEIIIRNFTGKIRKERRMPNYFGEQRFSLRNVEIGRMLLKSDFKNAIKVILSTDVDCKEEIEGLLKQKPNDYVRALKIIPKKLLLLYVHAYQSYLWNMLLEAYVKVSDKDIMLPIIGFGTEIEDERNGSIMNKIMEKEGISPRSFINKQIPEISLEGGERNAFVEIKDFKILERGDDFIKVGFKLPKGSYATVTLKFLLA